MTQKYPGGFVTLTPPTLDPALGAATQGIWTLDQALTAAKLRSWPMYDPYYNNVVLNLHGNGTNGAQNNTFLDSSTNNFTITRNGNTTQGSFSPYGDNWSNYFTTDYLSISSAAADISGGAFTVECWAMRVATSGAYSQWIAGKRSTSGGDSYVFSWNLAVNNAGKLAFSGTGITPSNVTSPNTMTVGQWYHVAAVSDGTNVRLYENGVLVAGPTSLPITNYGYGGTIGNYPVDNPYFNGYISNLRIVKGVQVYTSNFTPPNSQLKAISGTSLLTCQSNRFIDNSTNGYAITTSGSPSVQRFQPFLFPTSYTPSTIGGSGYFDGSGDNVTTPSNAVFGFGTGDFSVETWVYITSSSPVGFFQNGTDNCNVQRNTSGNLEAWDGTTRSSSTPMPSNAWHHVMFTRVGTSAKVFLNGVSVLSWTSSVNYSTTSWIFGYTGNGSNPMMGYMADCRVLKGTGYSSVTVPTSPLTAITNTSLLLSMTNSGIVDNAMMSDLETVGAAQISTSVKKYGTASITLAANDAYLLAPPTNNLEFGSGDFTIEFWWYPTSTARQALYHGSFGADWSIGIDYSSVSTNQKIGIWASSNGSSWNLINSDSGGNGIGTTTITQNAWNHIAYVRSGTTWMLYVNGSRDLNLTGISGSIVNRSTYSKGIGVWYINNTMAEASGYLDDIRITKGVARYVANFTPPTSQLQDQ